MLPTSRSFTAGLLASVALGVVGWLVDGPLAGLVLGGVVVLAAVLLWPTPAGTDRFRARRVDAVPSERMTASEDPTDEPLVSDKALERPPNSNGTGNRPVSMQRPESD